DRPAAMFPVILAVLPGLVARLADARNREGAPSLLAGAEVGCINPATDAELAAGRSDDGEITHDQRRQRYRLAKRRLRGFAFPNQFAGGAIERKDASVERNRDHLVFPQRDSTIVDAAAGDVTGPYAVNPRVELPFDVTLLAARHIDCIDRAPAVWNVHHGVID